MVSFSMESLAAVAQAIGFEMGDLSFAGNDHDPAGQALLLDEFFHLGVDFRQGLPGQADFGRVDRRQFGDRLSGGEKAGKERKEKAGWFVHGLIRELVGEGRPLARLASFGCSKLFPPSDQGPVEGDDGVRCKSMGSSSFMSRPSGFRNDPSGS